MKYQHFSEKLMVLDREEEAKRMMIGGGQQQYGGGNSYPPQQQASYGQPAATGPPPGQAQPDPNDPYAVYGGYQNYMLMWALSQQQAGQGGAQPPPQ